ncbi:hypothetical protein SALB1_3559 [Salinisphaera sp. LB1]|nr:hypothetical protein SALB1_3559 [Salinisphaera sp. LB1]
MRCPGLPGIHWEAKRTERLRLYEAVEQAGHDAGDKLPVVAHKANHREWLAVLPLSDLLAILRASDYCLTPSSNSEGSNACEAR